MERKVLNSRGQFAIEAILLLMVTVGLFVAATNQLRERQVLAKLVEGPWKKVAGMIETGVWEDPKTARAKHPNQANRGVTFDPNR